MLGKSHRPRRRLLCWIERSLWVVGFVVIGYCAFLWARAEYDQTQGNWALERLSRAAPPPDESANLRGTPEGSLVGRIEIPRLDLFAVVFEGTSEDTLARGVGHLTGSAAPGERGNLVLAGHRDTFFRELRGIHKGDSITVRSPEGKFRYRVESTVIVYPNQTEILQAGNESSLTLITCFPFSYIGNAPQRFVVRARKVANLEPLPPPQRTQ
jgi:sortase A